MPALDGTFPFRVAQVSSTRPFPQTNHRHLQRREHSSASQHHMRYLFLARLVSSDSACLSLSVVLARFSTVSLRRKCQLSRRAGRKRAGEQIRIEQQSAGLRTAGARPLFDPRLAAHAFLTANPQHQPKSHRTAPHCTAPHRSASSPALRTFDRPACLFAAACYSQQFRRAVVSLPASHPAVVAVSIRKTSAPTGVAPAAAPHSSLPGSTSMLDTIPTLLSLIIFFTY